MRQSIISIYYYFFNKYVAVIFNSSFLCNFNSDNSKTIHLTGISEGLHMTRNIFLIFKQFWEIPRQTKNLNSLAQHSATTCCVIICVNLDITKEDIPYALAASEHHHVGVWTMLYRARKVRHPETALGFTLFGYRHKCEVSNLQ